MKTAMLEAEVGDDVYDEDPTIHALQNKAARLFGKDAALFCPSGTMANQLAIKVHTQPGDEVICDALAHVYNYEGGGIAFHSGCSIKLIHSETGQFTATDVEERINPNDPHYARSRLVCVENTCNKGGGTIWQLPPLTQVADLCEHEGLKLHLDGARLFNALVESDYSAKDLGRVFDSISICLSKGLGAPVGSILVGSRKVIEKAHRYRKLWGGGMRQAGYLAAAGIYALDNHIDRLREDHQKARTLAESLVDQPFVDQVHPSYTNIVLFELAASWKANDFLTKLAEHGIQAGLMGPRTVRLVTHLDILDADVARTLETWSKIR